MTGLSVAPGPFVLLCLFYRSGPSTSCWAGAHDLCFLPLKVRVRWPCLPCLLLTAKGRTAVDFPMGLFFLVTDSIFDARKYVFKSGRKKHAEKKHFFLHAHLLNV